MNSLAIFVLVYDKILIIKEDFKGHGSSVGEPNPDWIIIFFFIHIDAFREENEESTLWAIFIDGILFEKLGSETFQKHFEASNDVLWG